MSIRSWTKLALLSAMAGFVLSGPPPDFQSTTRTSDVVIPAVAPIALATTELARSEIDNDAAQEPNSLSAQTEDSLALEALP